jgi:hypothetical protein
VKFEPNGSWEYDTDIPAHEEESNPDGGAIDSNPYGLLAGESSRIVADAGANALLSVGNPQGKVSTTPFRTR